jgi:NADPH:quinone reductase-like Zn-dependent oxidoreductase
VVGTTLRSRPLDQRIAIIEDVRRHVWPMIPGTVRPVIYEQIPLREVTRAHVLMDEHSPLGKVVLTVD